MNPYTPFVVTNFPDGIRTDTEPFLIPDGASPNMLNATLFRGRIVEKGGDSLLCNPGNIGDYFRGRIGVRNGSGATTDSSGSSIIPSGTVIYNGAVDPGTVRITVGTITVIDNALDGTFVLYSGGPATITGQINYSTGVLLSNLTGFGSYSSGTSTWSAIVVLPPSSISPVMGCANFQMRNSSGENLIAFDTIKPYNFNAITDQFQLADKYESTSADKPTITFNGSDSQFFWCLNYADGFWVTNGNPGFQGLIPTAVTTGTTTTFTFSIAAPFLVNDYVFIWDLGGVSIEYTGDIAQASGQVISVSGNTIVVDIETTGTWTGGGTVQAINRQIITGSAGGDGIKWYDLNGWHNFSPPLTGSANNTSNAGGSAIYLMGAELIVSYRGYLLFFNTFEGTTLANAQQYQNRCRRSAAGTPYYASPVPTTQGTNANSFSQYPGFGGFTDSPINEDIISSRFCRDELIISHETHDVRLDFTGNPSLLFIWARVNDQFGAESKFSMINADTVAVKMSRDGITQSQGIDTTRMDIKVPDLIYRLSNTDDGKARVHGYRNFVSLLFKWCCVIPQGYPSYLKFPNSEVVYNYALDTWSINKTYRTVYNQFQLYYDNTWANAKRTWASSNFPWNSIQSRNGDQISVVGNSQGFFHKLDEQQITSQSYNDRGYRVTAINSSSFLSVPNHSFKSGDFVFVSMMTGSNSMYNGNVYMVQFPTINGFYLVNQKGVIILFAASTTTSPPAGFLAVVDQFEYWTKKYYVGGNEGLQTRLGYVDVFFQAQDVPSTMSVDIYLNDNNAPSKTVSFPLQRFGASNSEKIISRVYINAMAQAVQLKFYYSNADMFDYNTGYKQFVLHGYTLYIKQSGRMVSSPRQS